MTKFVRLLAWLALAAIAVTTISPLQDRPHFGPANLERVTAFLIMGSLFGFAYRDHWLRTILLVAVAAGSLELAQLVTPDRHAQFSDASLKAIAGMVGVLGGAAVAEVGRIVRPS